MKPYISTESHMERANSRALSPVPFAAEPKDAPSMRYTGFFIGSSCRRQKPIALQGAYGMHGTKIIKYFER